MEKAAEKFLKAEEIASKLAESLQQLYNEANSYHTAKEELESVRKKLLNLIEGTEKAINGSYEIIKTMKEIGTPEILNRIAKIEIKLLKGFNKQLEVLDSLNKYLPEAIQSLENKIEEESISLTEKLGKIKAIIIFTFISLIVVLYLLLKFVT